jgi:primosomal protein N' (replication factor Y) (superfamily II helicase)
MYAKVVVDIEHSKVDRIFSYAVPKDINVFIGSRVLVPFGRSNKKVEGYILGFSEKVDFDVSKIKSIIRTLREMPEFTEGQLNLAQKIKDFYITPLVTALRLMYPSEMRGERVKEQKRRCAKIILDKDALTIAKKSLYTKEGKLKAPAMLSVLEELEKQEQTIANLSKDIPSAPGAIKSMVKKGWVDSYEKESNRKPYSSIGKYDSKIDELTDYQKSAVEAINNGKGDKFLIHGVTGSGKTEVYIRAIEHCINSGKTAIMLVPEIALTPQLIQMFNNRLDKYIAIYHSGLSSGERYDEWRKINSGKARVVIGPRSALFVPFKNIGLIILDEEHENSYRADQHPKYKTHDIAKMRAEIEGANLVFSSATPSVETYFEAKSGNMKILNMPSRINNIAMPDVYVEDMRRELRQGNRTIFSGRLYDEIVKTLKEKKQIILFINRRGFSSFVMCRGCGHIVRCDDCDVSMTLHKNGDLVCHYCGKHKDYNKICEECGLPYVKLFGIGTQQIEHQINKHFPGAKTLRMDFDTTRKKDSHAKIYHDFKQEKADILIGTQLVAKGLDFENVTLVGAVAADVSLHFPDYLAIEKTYSLLEQVSGRAGRKDKGTVVIQTYNPEHYAIQHAASHDYVGFYQEEIKERQKISSPPFGVIVRLVFIGIDDSDTKIAAKKVETGLKKALEAYKKDILVLKSSPAPIKKIMSKPRFHIVLKVKATDNFSALKNDLYDCIKEYKFDNVNFGIEINPQNMF